MLASLFVGLAMSLGHKGPPGVWVYRAGQDPGIMTAAWGQEPGPLKSPWYWYWPSAGFHSDIRCSDYSTSLEGVISLGAGLPGFGEAGGYV